MYKFCLLLLASVLLLSAVPLAGVPLAHGLRPAYPLQQQARQTPDRSADVRTFAGKISRSGGRYVLEDLSVKTSLSLDDQKAASQYEGKTVIVTGSLDTSNNMIHVQKIEIASCICSAREGASGAFPFRFCF